MWTIVFTKKALKDAKKASSSHLRKKLEIMLKDLQKDPFNTVTPYKELDDDLKGAYSRRISYQHRLVYEVYQNEKTVKIIRMWNHY